MLNALWSNIDNRNFHFEKDYKKIMNALLSCVSFSLLFLHPFSLPLPTHLILLLPSSRTSLQFKLHTIECATFTSIYFIKFWYSMLVNKVYPLTKIKCSGRDIQTWRISPSRIFEPGSPDFFIIWHYPKNSKIRNDWPDYTTRAIKAVMLDNSLFMSLPRLSRSIIYWCFWTRDHWLA